MRRKDKMVIILVMVVAIAIITFFVSKYARVKLMPAKHFVYSEFNAKDSSMIMGRHMGYINYERFVELVKKEIPDTQISIEGDSACFSTQNLHYYLGQEDDWTRKYRNIPIHINKDGFSAKLQKIDTVQYVLLPFQILSNVAKLDED